MPELTDARGVPLKPGARIVYGFGVGRSVAMAEGVIEEAAGDVSLTPSGRVWVQIVRRSYSSGTDAHVHIAPDRLVVVQALPPSPLPTQAQGNVADWELRRDGYRARLAALAEGGPLAKWEEQYPREQVVSDYDRWLVEAERNLAEARHLVEAEGAQHPEPDTLPAWLAMRFDARGAPWNGMSDDDRTYWEDQARAVRRAIARDWFKAADEAQQAPAPDLPERLKAALTQRYTALGNPFSGMRYAEKGPDGWPAEHPIGPHHVAEVLRELLADGTQQAAPAEAAPVDCTEAPEAAARRFASRLAAVETLCSGRRSLDTLTVQQVLAAMNNADTTQES